MKKTVLLAGLLGGLAVSVLPLMARADSDPITLTFKEKDGHFDIQGRFEVEADRQTAWDTLTDFESYPKFSHELKKVQIKERSKNRLVIEEVAESGVLFFTQKVFFTLDVKEKPGKSFVSTDVGHKSFVFYQSQWDLKPAADGKTVELIYHLRAEGHFGGPAFMVNDTFKGGVQNFLRAMRKEILRRQTQKEKGKN